ncbi:ABC-three component system protein [Streptomyces tirandamycinicus]|uniref:ABC-three component system protein n=1 Tax=Streptomyces tirandamycinicus TaxID=2174846 RepID=UPI00343098D5
MSVDQDRAWFHSQFLALCIRKTGFEWQDFVTALMHMKHGPDFVQIDPSGRGDKGCDGWVNGLMLACYGASSPTEKYVSNKIRTDYETAEAHWGTHMERWAFVYNNATGLPAMAAAGIMELRKSRQNSAIKIENWPPQVLWDNCVDGELERNKLSLILGAPPSEHPAGMTYIARCVETLARTRLQGGQDEVLEVPFGKIEHNDFGPEVSDLLKTFKTHTGHVRFYFSQASPGEQAQVSENLRARYDGHRARLEESDAVFHALCDDLVSEAFGGGGFGDANQQRSAAMMVVTHFFETCEIFEAPVGG